MQRNKLVRLFLLLAIPALLSGCAGVRISFSPNPLVMPPDATEIVGTVTLSGKGIGSVTVNTIKGTAFLKDNTIYYQKTVDVNRSLPAFFGSVNVSEKIRIPLDPGIVPGDIDRIVIEVTGSDPGQLVVYVEVRDK